MHILWQLQLSSVNTEGKYLVGADSNWSFARNIIKGMMELYEDVHVSLLFPIDRQCATGHSAAVCMAEFQAYNGRVHLVPYNYDQNAFTSRFTFDFEQMTNAIQTVELIHGKIDIVWVNDPALVMNWRVLLHMTMLRDHVKIVSYNHWIDNLKYPKTGGYFNYTMRQIEGALHSDLHLLNSDFAKMMLYNSFEQFGMQHLWPKNKVHAIPNIVDVDTYESYHWKPEWKKFKIIYNHRISTMDYYKEAFGDFIDVCDELQRRGFDNFKVVLTNPSGKDLLIKRKYIQIKTALPYKQYLEELASAGVVVSTFRPGNGGMWSSSIMEGLAMGVPTLVPKHSGYTEMVPRDYAGYFTKSEEIPMLIIKLIANHEFGTQMGRQGQDFMYAHFTPEAVCTQLNELLGAM